MAERVTARMAAFIPGASPPEVRMPTQLICAIVYLLFQDTKLGIKSEIRKRKIKLFGDGFL